MIGTLLSYTLGEIRHSLPNSWYWIYSTDLVAMYIMLLIMAVFLYQNKLWYRKGLCAVYSVCALGSVVYLALRLQTIAYCTQAVPVSHYVLFYIKYYLVGVGFMLGWLIWRTSAQSKSTPKYKRWIVWGVILLMGFCNSMGVAFQEMTQRLILDSYLERANHLYLVLFALLLVMEEGALKLGK